ncbi:MAG TPA: electron transport complex subunit E [Spirochaetota bacterium]|nr:electron transport complex subunit E [Spirochaetota bacterium]HPC41095.1 electron transport complex subunit E [Spirochaetota bacterium]HPL16969.1 electron transport complex subunit E [Spirochaetota bacterium]HQF08792.1 electron transport complex subunit E [Spirochaetota bacterium]HQH97411.1 electron transport complex subunit E [Spirochaetota bacterium]
MRHWKELVKGIWSRNPQLVLGLAFCPTLAVSTSVSNALWMTLAATFVLVCSNLLISSIRKIVPGHLRIPLFITIIASFVTVVDLLLNAYQPEVYRSLGIFIPLIVVNCIILGRAEEFAQKNGVFVSVLDGIGMGIGFGLTLTVLAAVREVLGANSLFGYTLIPGMEPATAMVMAPGAFFTLALMLWAMNAVNSRSKRK